VTKFENGLEAEKMYCPQEQHACLRKSLRQDKYKIVTTVPEKKNINFQSTEERTN
jgi:hypothetical protein